MSIEWCSSIGDHEVCGDASIMLAAVLLEVLCWVAFGSLAFKFARWRTNRKSQKKRNRQPPPF